jgi:demethylmenaquinone methyltransferase/2-methoxy-6-polyprenyl-1,4-benzoquinol methylase
LSITRRIKEAIEEILEDYEKVNHLISFFQDDRARKIGLDKIVHDDLGLEIGSGPGNFTRMIRSRSRKSLVCLDYSDLMLRTGRERSVDSKVSFVRGVFEALPFRRGVFAFSTTAYALRDSSDKLKALREIRDVLKKLGILVIIDIGKPDNPLLMRLISMYIKYFVPVIGGLASQWGYRNPWRLLSETYERLPTNRNLLEIIGRIIGPAEIHELFFGGLVVAWGKKEV